MFWEDMEADGHASVDYRPEGESRHMIPAEVCKKCSDFEAGRLVPVSFCPVLGPLVEQEYREFIGY